MRIVFLFPGQGSQYVGMGKALFDRFALARDVYAEAGKVLGWDMERLCFEDPEGRLNQTEYTQPALLTASIAAWRAIGAPIAAGVAVAGHSLGEYTALVALGAVSFSDAVRVVRLRGRFMQEAVPEGEGAMAAIIGLGAKMVDDLCEAASAEAGVVSSANYNGPHQIVIAGETKCVEKAMRLSLEKGAKRAIRLPVSVPSHCPLMKPAAERLSLELDRIEGSDFHPSLVNNVSAKKVHTWQEARRGLVEQIASPLRWEESIVRMREDSVDLFVEVGPGRVLSGLVKRIDRKAKIVSVEDPEGVEMGLELMKGSV
ncbi:MAG: ACP S-malonyltransferase [Nitrospiria bacterium]